MDRWDFNEVAEFIRREFPVKHKVVIKRVVMTKNKGCTSRSDNDLITVTIKKSDTEEEQVYTLIHEWAHVLEFDKWRPHGRIWGRHYSDIYNAWENA